MHHLNHCQWWIQGGEHPSIKNEYFLLIHTTVVIYAIAVASSAINRRIYLTFRHAIPIYDFAWLNILGNQSVSCTERESPSKDVGAITPTAPMLPQLLTQGANVFGFTIFITRFGKAQIWLCSSRHDSTRSTCRAHALWQCRACRTARLDALDTTSWTGSTRRMCRVVSRCDVTSQVEFGLKQLD